VRVPLATDNLLGVLNHAYRSENGGVMLPLQFSMPDDTREAFILGNGGSGAGILSSTGWIDSIEQGDGSLSIVTGSPCDMTIRIPSRKVRSNVEYSLENDGTITLRAPARHRVKIEWEKYVVNDF
jgi:hypothetical protein